MFIFVLIVGLIKAGLAAEPSSYSTMFEYDEKVLAKIIRQEFMYLKLREDVTAFVQEIKADLAEIKIKVTNELNQNDDERLACRNDINEDRKARRAEFREIVDNNTDQMNNQMEELQKQKYKVATDAVAFVAKDVSDTTPSADQTFVFTTTLLNEGNGYNTDTGEFTAPTGGVYKFKVQLCLPSGNYNYIYFAIMADNKKIQGGFYRDNNTTKCYTADALVRLESGGKVLVKCDSGGCSGSMAQNTYYWNTFSGYRVHT